MKIISSDFHGAWQNRTGMNAPLYRRVDEMEADAMFNQVIGSIEKISMESGVFFRRISVCPSG